MKPSRDPRSTRRTRRTRRSERHTRLHKPRRTHTCTNTEYRVPIEGVESPSCSRCGSFKPRQSSYAAGSRPPAVAGRVLLRAQRGPKTSGFCHASWVGTCLRETGNANARAAARRKVSASAVETFLCCVLRSIPYYIFIKSERERRGSVVICCLCKGLIRARVWNFRITQH